MAHYKYDEITNKEMSRKQFLAFIGLGLVSILGFSNIIKTLTTASKKTDSKSRAGYGNSVYGL
jgi:hypothetical protein